MERPHNHTVPGWLEKYNTEYSLLAEDYLFTRLSAPLMRDMRMPMRAHGLTLTLCFKGYASAEANLLPFEIKPGTFTLVGRNSIVTIEEVSDDFDAYMLVMSPKFMSDINVDTNVLQSVRFHPEQVPAIELTEDEIRLLKLYLDLTHANTTTNTNPVYVRSITRSIMSAMVYQLIQFAETRGMAERDEDNDPLTKRHHAYVADFVKLVSQHFRTKRTISFYAARLYISPKYLSVLVKEATGRTAAEWINDYVLLEAKNLLRFSGKNIQQVAYELNFSTQSSFGKYFKHLTGMSPSEFQRS